MTMMTRRRIFLSLLLVPLTMCWGWLPNDKPGGPIVLDNHNETESHEDDDQHHHHHHEPHCGVAHVSNLQAELDQARMRRLFESDAGRRLQKLSCDELCDGCIEIDTVFHYTTFTFQGTQVLPHPTSAMRRFDSGDTTLRPSDFTSRAAFVQVLRDQIAYANAALRGTPFRFRLRESEITATNNNLYMRYPLDYTEEIALNLGSGDPRVLDVYLHYTILFQSEANDPPLRVGQAYMPSQRFSGNNPDGMFLRYDILTGGGFFSLDQGITFLHEWGHWMGLYHTFRTSDGSEFGCEGFPNDYVFDTPAHQGDSFRFDCRQYIFPNNQPFPDTCPILPGRDPVLNYMNYVNTDTCLDQAGEFTCGQIQRMYYQWIFYRETIAMCPQGEKEIEFAYEFDRNHEAQNRVLLYELAGGRRAGEIYDSLVDHADKSTQGVLAVDICLPESIPYELLIVDSAGDGFSRGGELEVYQNGQLVGSTSGYFGSEFSVILPPIQQPTPPPTRPPTRAPTRPPTRPPTEEPTPLPTTTPVIPTQSPTEEPTPSPTRPPTRSPTDPPTRRPTTLSPTVSPTASPVEQAIEQTGQPTSDPTLDPTPIPTTEAIIPTISPTVPPTASPVEGIIEQTAQPTANPTSPRLPVTAEPTATPIIDRTTQAPTMDVAQTSSPTRARTTIPPKQPTRAPRPIKMMKSKQTQRSMKKLGSSPSRSSMSKSKKYETKKDKKSKMSSKSMRKDNLVVKKSRKSSMSNKMKKIRATPAPTNSQEPSWATFTAIPTWAASTSVPTGPRNDKSQIWGRGKSSRTSPQPTADGPKGGPDREGAGAEGLWPGGDIFVRRNLQSL